MPCMSETDETDTRVGVVSWHAYIQAYLDTRCTEMMRKSSKQQYLSHSGRIYIGVGWNNKYVDIPSETAVYQTGSKAG